MRIAGQLPIRRLDNSKYLIPPVVSGPVFTIRRRASAVFTLEEYERQRMGLQEIEWVVLGGHSSGSMHERTLSRRYSSSFSPYARRWKTRILLLSPSTKPSETLFSGLQ